MAEYGNPEYSGGGELDAGFSDSSRLGGGGELSSDEEIETMTAAEVLEKLEEVKCLAVGEYEVG